MINRRQFLVNSAATGFLPFSNESMAENSDKSYQEAVSKVWRPISSSINDKNLLKRELVRYATLAASSHNTQCWKFKITENQIIILPDFDRRCPVVDPDNHHLFVSLGAASENLLQAALYFGLQGEIDFDVDGNQTVVIKLTPTKSITTPLFNAIPHRQCTRAEYDGKELSVEELNLLEIAGSGEGVHIMLHTEEQAMENILAYVIEGNSTQLNDEAFMTELRSWIRFNSHDAIRTKDGLYSVSSGSPNVPNWLGNALFKLMLSEKNDNDKYAKQVRSSAGVALFVSEVNDHAHWLEVGRCYERFALQATALGIKSAFLNQAVEVTRVRQQLETYLNLDSASCRVDLIVRFGHGNKMPSSLRRPVESVII